MNITKKSTFKGFFGRALSNEKKRYLQTVPVVHKAEMPASGPSAMPLAPASTSSSSSKYMPPVHSTRCRESSNFDTF